MSSEVGSVFSVCCLFVCLFISCALLIFVWVHGCEIALPLLSVWLGDVELLILMAKEGECWRYLSNCPLFFSTSHSWHFTTHFSLSLMMFFITMGRVVLAIMTFRGHGASYLLHVIREHVIKRQGGEKY